MIIRNKFSGYSADGIRIYPMGGGGGQTQTTSTDVPGWAKPTAERMLGHAEALSSDRPYTSYADWASGRGINPSQVAGFQGLQQQAFQGAGNLQTSPELGQAQGLAGLGSLGSLGAGQNYMRMATDPSAMQGFMSPYMQNVVNTQQQEAIRQSGIQGAQNAAQAVQAGAFGGSRAGLLEAERQRNLGTQLGSIQAQGLQNAFQNAQQAQQFGANLGLQGYGQAIQGAGQLANIGTQQFGQQKDIIGLQSQLGAQQQQQEQAKINQQIQDYQAQQKYPYQQLEFLSNILRGTPMGTVQSMYQGPGSAAGQIAGLGMGAYGLSKAFGFAEGGSVDSDQNVADILDNLSDQQLAQAKQSAIESQDVRRVQLIDEELAKRASLRQGMGGAFNSLPQEAQDRVLSAAGGGMVAFANNPDQPISSDMPPSDPMGTGAMDIANVGGSAPSYSGPGLLERLVSAPEQPEWKRAAQQAQAAPAPAKPAPTGPAQTVTPPTALSPEFDKYLAKDTKLSRSERSAANKVATAMAAQAPVNRNDLKTDIEEYLKAGKREDSDALKSITSAIKEMTKLPEYDKNEALAKFGFAMAAAASKPGARFLGSISAAAPEALAHREAYQKKVEDAKKLAGQLQIEQAKFELGMKRDDRKMATDAAVKARELQLQEQKLAQDAAYHKAALGKQTGVMAVYEELKKNNPEADPETLLRKASEISGYSYRTEAKQSADLSAEINKINERYKMYNAIPPDSPMRVNAEAQKKREIEDAYRRLGGGQPQPSGVTSAAGPVLRFDAKGNMIQ